MTSPLRRRIRRDGWGRQRCSTAGPPACADFDPTSPPGACLRLECGFACVRCRGIPAQYEHFDPTFEEMLPGQLHRPEGIALLCSDCHSLKTNNRALTRQMIRTMRNREHGPISGRSWSWDASSPLKVFAGTNWYEAPAALIESGSQGRFFYVDRTETGWSLTAKFLGDGGEVLLDIQENVIEVGEVQDFTWVGDTLTVEPRSDQSQTLKLRLNTEEGVIEIISYRGPAETR